MRTYTLFYSWQSDEPASKRIIYKSLAKVQKKLKEKGVELVIDQDTRKRVGKTNINNKVLEKIRNCHIFLADLTPVTTIFAGKKSELDRHMPNSNVLYELGYAQGVKGDRRIITVAKLKRGEHVELMPFDINHDTINFFKTEDDLNQVLPDLVWNIIQSIEDEAEKKDYACSLLLNGLDHSVLCPKYRRRHYVEPGVVDSTMLEKPVPKNYGGRVLQQGLKALAKAKTWTALQDVDVDSISKKLYNDSVCGLHMYLHNEGLCALENCEVHIELSTPQAHFVSDSSKWIEPKTNTIADDYVRRTLFEKISIINPNSMERIGGLTSLNYVHVPYDCKELVVHWCVQTKTVKLEGESKLQVVPTYVDKYVEDANRVGEVEMLDYEEVR